MKKVEFKAKEEINENNLFLTFWAVLDTYSNILLRIVIPKFIREVGIRLLLLVVYVLYILGWLNLTGLIFGFVSVYGMAMFEDSFTSEIESEDEDSNTYEEAMEDAENNPSEAAEKTC